MNWVGGSRNRLVMKNNAKKQREFFEKRKMQQKLRNLGINVPAPSPGTSSGSMDLVTLFVVNQIAANKENKDPPKVAVLRKEGSKHKRHESLVLPMSPCSPSQLSIVESPSQYSVQGMRKRTHVIPQGFKCRQLSPVLESAFSDNSASDYLPPRADPLSPFSSTSSVSSGQGIFPVQFSLQQRSQTQPWPQCFPPHWDSSELDQTKPFSQLRGTTCNIPLSCGPNPRFCQLETPTAAQVLFGSPEPDSTELRESERQEVRFSFSQLGDKEPLLDFTLNQSETEQQFEEDVFRGFCNEEYEREGSGKSRMNLTDETPIQSATPQTVPESESGVELSSLINHSNGTYTNCSGPGHKTSPMNSCEYFPSYSCRGGYLSSDSNDEAECCQPCVNTPASLCINQACCADTPRTQGRLKQRYSQSLFRSSTPLIKAFKDDQDVMETVACPDKACRSVGQQKGSSTAQCFSPDPLAKTQHCVLCKCQKISREMQEVGTQTVPTVRTCDASTQCNTVAEDTRTCSSYLPPIDVSMQHPATRRQTDTAVEPNTHTVLSGNWGGEQCVLWRNKSMDYSLSGSCTLNKLNNSDDRVTPGSINPSLDALIVADNKGNKTGESSGETGQQENSPLMKDFSYAVREDITSATRVNRLSGEAETLQEIADILLLLKQRKVGCEGWTV